MKHDTIVLLGVLTFELQIGGGDSVVVVVEVTVVAAVVVVLKYLVASRKCKSDFEFEFRIEF